MNYFASNEDEILGVWRSENKEVKIEFYKNASLNSFQGKIIWIIEEDSVDSQPVLDRLNPDSSLKERRIVGLEFITGLTFNTRKKEWRNGRIYNPEDGKSYYLKGWLDDGETLKMRVSIDSLSMMGETFKWCRI